MTILKKSIRVLLVSALACVFVLSLTKPATAFASGNSDTATPRELLAERVVVDGGSNDLKVFDFKPFAAYGGSYKSELTDDEKLIYEEMYQHFVIDQRNDNITVDTSALGYTVDDFDTIFDMLRSAWRAFIFDHPEEFWTSYTGSVSYSRNIDTGQIIKLTVKFSEAYPNAYSELNTVNSGISSAVREITSSRESGSRYHTVKAIHDYICNHVCYDYGEGDHRENQGIAPLFGGGRYGYTYVCAGYASSFKLLCDKFDIPCARIRGGGHSWNIVQMEDGKWYAIDVTWDDGDTIKYDYFLVGSNFFNNSHSPDGNEGTVNPRVYPVMSETDYVYSLKPAFGFYNWDGISYMEGDYTVLMKMYNWIGTNDCQVDIYIDGTFRRTIYSDSEGFFTYTIASAQLQDGNHTITAEFSTNKGLKITDQVNFHSFNSNVPATGITLSQTSLSINKGKTSTLTATVTPFNTTDSVVWRSSDTAIATVSGGKVTAVAPGTATISAKAGNQFASCKVTVTIPATAITLSQTTLSLNKGNTSTLTATVTPADSTDSVTWTSSDTNVATVSGGTVTAVGGGTATITAKAGSKSATCTVTVKSPATAIILSQTTLSLNKGATSTLTATVTPADSTDSVTWTSSNTAVATVSSGTVTAVGNGSATITAKAGSKSATCTVTVTNPATAITLSQTTLSVNKGNSSTLTATVTPADSTDSVTWTSSNTAVATVSSGTVTAVGNGSATITAKAGSKSATCTVTVTNPATAITLSQTTLSVNKGNSSTLTATVTPADSTDSVTWTSSDTAVATVSNGTVTAVSPGTATITAKAGSKSATCTVTVKSPATAITLSQTTLSLNKGATSTLTATVKPNDCTDSVTWTSSNTAVATVSNGTVTAVSPGTATITAKAGSKSATCTVTVKSPATAITLSQTTLSVNKGNSSTLTATVTPADSTDSVTWTSSDTAVATVSNGTVTAVSPGTATITAKAGSKSATCTVTVKIPATGYVLSPSLLSLIKGQQCSVSFTLYPEDTTDVAEWFSSDTSVATVSNNGTVTAVGVGNANIVINAGRWTATCPVTVYVTPLTITTQPASKNINLGDSVILSLTAQGDGLTYQWYYKKAGASSYSVWSGRTHASETATPNSTWNGINFYCVVKDSHGNTATSNVITIRFNDVVTIVKHPVNVTSTTGKRVTFSVEAEGVGLSYQWQYRKAGATSWSTWNGHTTATTSATSNATWDGMRVRCIVKNSGGKSVASNAALLTLSDVLAITAQPANVTSTTGKSVTFTVKAKGIVLTYQWQYRKAGETSWSTWNGHTTASTSATSNATWDGMQVRCIVKDSSGKTLTSNAAKLTLSDVLAITSQPANVTSTTGKSVTFTVKAKGTGLTYQWQYMKAGETSWSTWNGHTTATTSATSNATWNGMKVRCIVKDSNGKSVTSNVAKLTLK